MSTTRIREISINDRAYQLLLLLAVSSSRSLPALLFTRPFSPTRIVSQGDLNFATLYKLFRVDESEDEANTTPEQYALLPSTFGCDWQYGAHQIGPELEALRRQKYLEITYEEKITFMEISHDLRQEIWAVFARDPDTYRNVQIALCSLIILSLPVPYAAPLWEMTSFACKDVIASTLIPFLFTSPGAKDFQEKLMTEDDSCLLIFHLTNLGFALDDVRWEPLFDNSHSSNVISFFKIHKEISGLLNVPSSESLIENWKPPQEFDLPQNSFGASLLGLTIAQIPWKCSNPIVWEHFEAWRSCWSNSCKSRQAVLDEVAYAIIHPESIHVSELESRLPNHSLYALAIGLSRAGHLETSSRLLDFSLRASPNESSSQVYGLLFAELLKSLTLLSKASEASILGTAYLKATHTSNAYISIATADAFIAIGKYDKAQKILHHILSDTSIGSFEEICTILRLNKVWRRKPDLMEQSGFANNLARVVRSIRKEDVQIQEDYMTELQATVYHITQFEEPVPSELCQVIEDTLKLFKEDDAALQKQRSTLSALLQASNAAPGPHESSGMMADKRKINSDPTVGSNLRVNTTISSLPISQADMIRIQVEKAWEKRNLLSLDGGGTRGFWTLLVLDKLMNLISQEEWRQFEASTRRNSISSGLNTGSDTNWYPVIMPLPCHYFDLICGLNTSSVITLMLAQIRTNIPTCIRHYRKILNHAFGRPRPASALGTVLPSQLKYIARDMADAMKSLTYEYGGIVRMNTAPGTCSAFVPTLCHMNANGLDIELLYIIRSYDHFEPDSSDGPLRLLRTNYGPASRLKMWEVVQAATTAPANAKDFLINTERNEGPKTIRLSGLDGYSLTNPTKIGLVELKALYGIEGVGFIVSVGAAQNFKQPPSRSIFSRIKKLGFADSDIQHVAMQYPERYWRFNDEEGVGIESNEWKPNGFMRWEHNIGKATMKKIEYAFEKWASQPENIDSLTKCAHELVKTRRLRMLDQERWKRYAPEHKFVFGDENNVGDPSSTAGEGRDQSESIV